MIDDIRCLAQLFAHVGRAIVMAPARWRARQWSLFVAVAAATAIAYVEKWPIQAYVQRGGGSVVRAIAWFVDGYTGGFFVVVLCLVLFVAGRWTRKPVFVEAALVLGAAGLWCWIFSKVGRTVLAEHRPNHGGAMAFFSLDGHGVSGHATSAGLLFSPIRDVLARGATPRARRMVTAALLVWAAFVGWSRVWLGMHFLWNVILGLAIGFFTGFVATRAPRTRPAQPPSA